MDRAQWPALKERVAAIFTQKTRDEMVGALMEGRRLLRPVLTMEEAPQHPHNQARGTFVEVGGVVQPGPSPRFSEPGEISGPRRPPARHR